MSKKSASKAARLRSDLDHATTDLVDKIPRVVEEVSDAGVRVVSTAVTAATDAVRSRVDAAPSPLRRGTVSRALPYLGAAIAVTAVVLVLARRRRP